MNFFNPFQMMMNPMMSQVPNPNPMQMMQMGKMPNMPQQPINHQQFIQNTAGLNKDALAGLVNQARAQGMSEDDIKNGLDFLLQLRK